MPDRPYLPFVGRDTVEFPNLLAQPILDPDLFPIDNRINGNRRLTIAGGRCLPPHKSGCFGAGVVWIALFLFLLGILGG